jgi:hypothetical protein
MTTPKKTEPKVPAEAAESVSDNHASAVPNGVIVIKSVADDGSITTEVSPLGNVQATEIQTLLELGVQSWRRQIGL